MRSVNVPTRVGNIWHLRHRIDRQWRAARKLQNALMVNWQSGTSDAKKPSYVNTRMEEVVVPKVVRPYQEQNQQRSKVNGKGKSHRQHDNLTVDVTDRNGLSHEDPPITIRSVDSGIRSGSHSSASNDSVNGDIHSPPMLPTTPPSNPNGDVTKFAQSVAKLVDHVISHPTKKSGQPKQQQQMEESMMIDSITIERPALILERVQPEPEKPKELKPRVYKLLPRDIEFCSYMLETYGTDYDKMSSDGKNVFQDNPRSIARKIRIFKDSPHYKEYLDQKPNAKH